MDAERVKLLPLVKVLRDFFDMSFPNRIFNNLPEYDKENWLEIAKEFKERTNFNFDKDKQNYLDLIEKSEVVWEAHGICVSNNYDGSIRRHLEPAIYELRKVLARIDKDE